MLNKMIKKKFKIKILKSKLCQNQMNISKLVNNKYYFNINREKMIIKMSYKKNQIKLKMFKKNNKQFFKKVISLKICKISLILYKIKMMNHNKYYQI